MANSILKLKVESEEYDAKLKKAAEGIRHLADVAHKGGGELTGLEKAELDYIKALGDMETKSRTAAGSTRELENAFKELTVIYNNLNDVEKADEGGKALAASLEKLKQRTIDAKSQLDAATKSLQSNESAGQSNSSALEQLASKFTINIDAIKLFNIGLQAAEGALNVAKDAFFASEANVDEWGRTIQSAQGLYEGFLNALNTGDISGYLSRMDEIVRAARAAYDELDKLGTMKTIQAPKVSAQQTENERIRSMIQTGRYIAPVDGRRNAVFNGREMQNGDKLTAGQIRALEKQLQNGMQNVVKLVGNEVKQTGKAIDAYYNSIAKQNGMSLQEFKKGTSSWEEFSKKMQGYEQYKEWDKQARIEFAKQGGRGNVDFDKNNPFAEFKKWGVFRVDKEGGNSYKDLVQLIQQRDQQAAQAYGMQSQAYRTMNRAEGFTVSKLMNNGGKGGSGSGNGSPKQEIQFAEDSIMAQKKLVQELTQEWETASGAMREGVLKQLDEAKAKLSEMTAVNVEPGSLEDYQQQLKKTSDEIVSTREEILKMKAAGADPMEISAKEDSLKAAVNKLDDIQKKVDYLNGKEVTVKIDIDTVYIGEGNTAMGEEMITGLQDSLKNAADNLDLTEFTEKWQEAMANGAEEADYSAYFENLRKSLGDAIDNEEWPKIKLAIETGDIGAIEKFQKKIQDSSKKTEKGWKDAAGSIGQLGSALQKIEDPGVKAVGTVVEAVASAALGFAQASKGPFTNPWEWIAFAASGLATMITMITTIHQATGMANGGIVKAANGAFIPGNNYSGDNVFAGNAWVNSGELVLNRAQQGNLAEQLEDSRNNAVGNSHPYVSGELIYLGVNNYLKRSGRGEIVTSRG